MAIDIGSGHCAQTFVVNIEDAVSIRIVWASVPISVVFTWVNLDTLIQRVVDAVTICVPLCRAAAFRIDLVHRPGIRALIIRIRYVVQIGIDDWVTKLANVA